MAVPPVQRLSVHHRFEPDLETIIESSAVSQIVRRSVTHTATRRATFIGEADGS